MILVTGATGFVGRHTVRRLCGDGLPVRAMVRQGAPHEYLERRGIEVVFGDVTEPATLRAAVAGVSTVVHLVGMLYERPKVTFESVVAEGTRSVVEAAEAAGVQRLVLVSSIGAAPDAASRYHRTKWVAEEAVRGFSREWVILRTSVIYGPDDDFTSMFLRWPLPLPGGGSMLLQPIWIDDMVDLILQATTRDDPRIVGQTHEVAGAWPLTMREMFDTLEAARGRSPLTARLRHPSMPLWAASLQAGLFDSLKAPLAPLGIVPPLTRDQVLMLATDNVCDTAPMRQVFGLEPLAFEEGARRLFAAPAA